MQCAFREQPAASSRRGQDGRGEPGKEGALGRSRWVSNTGLGCCRLFGRQGGLLDVFQKGHE